MNGHLGVCVGGGGGQSLKKQTILTETRDPPRSLWRRAGPMSLVLRHGSHLLQEPGRDHPSF